MQGGMGKACPCKSFRVTQLSKRKSAHLGLNSSTSAWCAASSAVTGETSL